MIPCLAPHAICRLPSQRIQGRQKGRCKGGGAVWFHCKVCAAILEMNNTNWLAFSVRTFHRTPVHISFAMTLTGQCGPACPGCRHAVSAIHRSHPISDHASPSPLAIPSWHPLPAQQCVWMVGRGCGLTSVMPRGSTRCKANCQIILIVRRKVQYNK